MHTLAKEKFAHAVADQLNAATAAGSFDQLVIVAPPHTMSAIRQELDTTTDAKIIGTLQKDLLKIPDHELWPHVRHWVRPVHRPKSRKAITQAIDLRQTKLCSLAQLYPVHPRIRKSLGEMTRKLSVT